MAVIGSIAIALGLNTAKFTKELKKSQTVLRRFAKRASRTFKNLKRSIKNSIGSIFSFRTALVGLAGAAGLGLFIKSGLQAGDVLAKTSSRLGIATEALAGMRHAAELTGVKTTTLDMALQRMTRRLAEAAMGTGEAKAALIELGLDAKKLSAGSPEKAFSAIAEAMNKVTSEGDKVRLSFKLFDSEGVALKNTLALGAQGLADAAKEAKVLGLALDGVSANNIEKANDSFTRLFGISKGLSLQLSAALAPAIEQGVKAFKDWILVLIEAEGGIKNFSAGLAQNIINAIQTIVNVTGRGMAVVANGAGKVANVFNGLKVVFAGVKLILTGFVAAVIISFEALDSAATALLNKISGLPNALGIVSDFKPNTTLKSWADEARESVVKARTELINLAETEVPSKKFETFAVNVITGTEKATAAIQKLKTAISEGPAVAAGVKSDKPSGTAGVVGDDSSAADKTARENNLVEYRAFLQRRVGALKESMQTEIQIEAERFQEAIRIQALATSELGIKEVEKNELLAEIRRQHFANVDAIEVAARNKIKADDEKLARQRSAIQQSVIGSFASAAAAVGSLIGGANKKQFEMQKKLGRASIVASTAVAIMKAWELPWPANLAAASSAALTGAAQLVNINRSTFGGGGSIGSAGGGAIPSIAPPTFPSPQQGQGQGQGATYNITFTGNVGDAEAAGDAIKQIIDATEADVLHITVGGVRADVEAAA